MKMEKVQERAIRLMYNDPTSPYQDLLQKHGHVTLHVQRLRSIALEVFKTLNDLNPIFMIELFDMKTLHHDLRDTSRLLQPKFRTIRYGRNSFSYYGAHLWNLLPPNLKLVCDIQTSKTMIHSSKSTLLMQPE
jgi:hypothetical protein